ncbi:DUF4097 family beta strand repeat-containing protein [Streptomyces sp. NPDC015125]|uniref:DUF4097 family beta strand repeat-containing protein n=1 Tax=Streptomyces sp. NPDC015125 TaxID=3364938 RepID=UPI0036F551CB
MARLRVPHLVLSCAALTVLVTGCSVSGFGLTKEAERTYTVKGKVTALSATTHGGDIEVVPIDAGGSVKVTEKYEYNKVKPSPAHGVKDGRLTLKAEECGMGRKCAVNYRVLLPRNASVDLRTSGGNITVRGASGGIAAETSGGDITVADSAARTAKARTSGGDVDLALSTAPAEVSGRTSGGSVTIRLPKGSYAVDASSSGGTRKVSVPTDEGSAHKVTARTSGGDVSVVTS